MLFNLAAAPLSSLGSLGSLASGIGSLASGFGFGQSKGKSQTSQRANQLLYDLVRPTQMVKAAKMAGLHPAYVMGTGQSLSPGFSGGGRSTDLDAIGAGAEKIATAIGGPANKRYQAQLRHLGLRQAEAEARRTEADAALMESELARARQGAMANKEGAATYPYGSKPSAPMQGDVYITGADGVRRKVSIPNLAEQGEPHYGEGIEIEAISQYLKDRGLPMARDEIFALLNEFRKGGIDIGRALHGFLNSRARARELYFENR